MYKIIKSLIDGSENTIKRKSDNAFIPKCSDNTSYQQFLADVKEQGLSIVEGSDNTTQSYVELRKNEYPSLEDQQDMQFWDQENGTSTWRDTIETIKNKYPKSISATTTIGPLPEWVQKLVE